MAKRELPKRLPPTAKEFCNLFDALDSTIHSLRLLLADLVELELDSIQLAQAQRILGLIDKSKPKPGRKASSPEQTATEPTATEPTATDTTKPKTRRKKKAVSLETAPVDTEPVEIATSESSFPEIVIACSGQCGKTTEGMTFETKTGTFRQVDESMLPEWTCPDCQAAPEPVEAGPVEKLGTDL